MKLTNNIILLLFPCNFRIIKPNELFNSSSPIYYQVSFSWYSLVNSKIFFTAFLILLGIVKIQTNVISIVHNISYANWWDVCGRKKCWLSDIKPHKTKIHTYFTAVLPVLLEIKNQITYAMPPAH